VTPQTLETLGTIFSIAAISGSGVLYQLKELKGIKSDLAELKMEHKEAKDILRNVAFSHDAFRRISHVVMDATHYLTEEDDVIANAFIMHNADASKACIEWAIESQLENITFEDFLVKYNAVVDGIKECLNKFSNEPLREELRKELKIKASRYLNRIRTIIEDTTPNSRVLRFLTSSELSMQEVTSVIVKTWIKHKTI
jgi:hypothetical protein